MSQVSDLTEITNTTSQSDESSYFEKLEKGLKCKFCNEKWSSLTATTKKAHLSNAKYSKEYKIRLCVQVSAAVSNAMVAKLDSVQQKAASKRGFNDRVVEEMNFELCQICPPHNSVGAPGWSVGQRRRRGR